MVFHAVATDSGPVHTLRDLDGVDGGEPGLGVRYKHLQSQVSQSCLEMISTKPVSHLAALIINDWCAVIAQ